SCCESRYGVWLPGSTLVPFDGPDQAERGRRSCVAAVRRQGRAVGRSQVLDPDQTKTDPLVGRDPLHTVCVIKTVAAFAGVVAVSLSSAQPRYEMVLVEQHPAPVLTVRTAGAQPNKYGYEGGRVVKIGRTYHLFTSEMFDD